MARREDGASLKRKHWSADDARKTLAAWERSGLSLAAYCHQRGIRPKRLYWWRSRLGAWSETPVDSRQERDQPRLIEAAVVSAVSSGPTVLLQLRSGDRLEVASTALVDADWVLRVAKGLCIAETDAR